MYAGYYGLKQEPFRLSPDPKFLHLAEPHRNTLTAMVEGIARRKGLQVSIGPIGTGKTTLLYSLQHILAREVKDGRLARSAFVVNPTLSRAELFETLFDELELAVDNSSQPSRLRALHKLLLDTHQFNGVVVIIIDEAHLLPRELLQDIRLMLNLDNYAVGVLQIVLCGQPEIVPLLMRPEFDALRQRIAVVSRLRPLTLAETRAYIAERLHVAGLASEGPFTLQAFEEIYRRSEGVPRRINLLCDRVLTAGERRQLKKIGPDLVSEAALEDSIAELDIGTGHNATVPATQSAPLAAAPKF